MAVTNTEQDLERRKYLLAHPEKGGPNGEQDQWEQDRYNAFVNIVNRYPSLNEFHSILPYFVGEYGDQRGNAYLSELAKQEASSPEKLAEQAPNLSPRVNELFKSVLGRDATSEESNHFAKLLATKQADEYELGEALKQLPEYQETRDETARQKLRGELQTADTQYFQEKILPAIQSKFAQQGRTVDSSSFASALANSAKEANTERERYLAGVGHEDYANRRQSSINTYLDQLGRTYANQDYLKMRNAAALDRYANRSDQIQDYEIQKRAYDEYVRNNGRRKKGLSGAGIGTLAGAGIGAALAPFTAGMSIPAGAMLGSSLGGAGGSIYDSY